jgi:hypothetical protein
MLSALNEEHKQKMCENEMLRVNEAGGDRATMARRKLRDEL